VATIDAEAVEVEVLTPEQAEDAIDRAARRYLRMSGAEFRRAWEAGEFDTDPDRPDVMRVAALLPLAG
jgi:hypothetical protein